MMEELQRQFATELVSIGRGRVERAAVALRCGSDGAVLRNEMHALAGEAAMLGFEELATAARNAERAAIAWKGNDEGARNRCADMLLTVDAALHRLNC